MALTVGLSMGCVVLVITMAASAIGTGAQRSEYQEKYASVASQLESIEESTDTEAMSESMSNAATIGSKVAAIQNKGIGGDRDYFLNEMRQYFTDKAYDQCRQWYRPTSTVVKPNWQFDSTYSFSADEIGVVWSCRNLNDESELLGYVTAKYSVEAGLFYAVDVHVTGVGKSYMGEEDLATSSILDLMSEIDGVNPNDIPKTVTDKKDGKDASANETSSGSNETDVSKNETKEASNE